MSIEQFQKEIEQLAVGAFLEFDDIANYIWKSPNLIEAEKKIELEKLDDYFPLKGNPKQIETAKRLRQMRWREESRRLNRVFPYVMANGNLFTCISVFETYCLMLCKALERHTNRPLSELRGSGVSKCFNYLSLAKIDLGRSAFQRQVQVAILVRNCLFHANGILDWSRDEKELRRIVASREYLPEYVRVKYPDDELDKVGIATSSLGDQIQISNGYCHSVCYYVKCHFADSCKQAQFLHTKSITISLPYSSAYV